MNPHAVLESLLTQEHTRTADLPRDQRGIYGLVDHTGIVRYIGSTSEPAENFRKRIHQRHRTGSETNSHYFSNKYNCGRMWRDRATQQGHPDAKVSKDLRSAFVAEYCRAVYVPLEGDKRAIEATEAAAILFSPPENVLWNRNRSLVYPEPTELVDALVAKLALTPAPKGSDRAPGKVASKRNNKRLMLGPA